MGTSITRKETCWIKYMIAVKGITLTDIARYAGCTPPMVSQVIYGRKRSAKVRKAIMTALGYDSFEKLLAGCEKHGS